MGPPPDLLNNYMVTKWASQVSLNNKIGITHVVPQDTAYTKLLLLFSLSSNLSINKLLNCCQIVSLINKSKTLPDEPEMKQKKW